MKKVIKEAATTIVFFVLLIAIVYLAYANTVSSDNFTYEMDERTKVCLVKYKGKVVGLTPCTEEIKNLIKE